MPTRPTARDYTAAAAAARRRTRPAQHARDGRQRHGRGLGRRVVELLERVLPGEPAEVVLADTIGVGVPAQVRLRTDLYELRLVDENDRDVPDGTPGEAVLRERVPFVTMAGYWGKPEATAEARRNGWLHTGDVMVRRDDGSYSFMDRRSHAIRRRGENISSLHIEQEVLSHDDVWECAAIGVPSEYSEDEVKIVVSLRPGATLTEPDLIGYLEPRLPAYMVPRYVEFRAELPKTQTGKVREDVLRADSPLLGWDREGGNR